MRQVLWQFGLCNIELRVAEKCVRPLSISIGLLALFAPALPLRAQSYPERAYDLEMPSPKSASGDDVLQEGHGAKPFGTGQKCPSTAASSGCGDSRSDENSRVSSGVTKRLEQPNFNQGVYYRNRLEFALDVGYLPINIPFVFDVFLGDGYNMTPLRYTLVPVVASLRWHINDVDGPWILRGNWDMTFSGSATAIPRGPETHYFSYDMGVRRNFVPRRGKIAPYFDGRLGLGRIDAKEPLGVEWAQGQNFTFTMNMGSGVRYNFNSRYSISAGLNWMHISNLYLSEPKFANYGINVYGPLFGIDVRLGKPRGHRSE